MKVILKETIDALGAVGSEVMVADGYARNYLFPREKAVPATAHNRRLMEKQKAKFELQVAKEKAFAEEMAKRLEGVKCTLSAKVSEEDRLYGSITVRDIVTALAQQEIEIEKKMVMLAEPIKTLGIHRVPIRIYSDIEPEIEVEVVPE